MTLFVLASSSPRRISILGKIGIPFRVVPPSYEVSIEGEDPIQIAKFTALEKARLVARLFLSGIVIGADTIVVVDGEVLGKPRNVEEAKVFLRKLSGREHLVVTGLALIDASSMREVSDYCVTKVWFRELSDGEIDFYVSTEEPLDKAGGYAIQGLGAFFVERIEGDFWNVVGFPLPLFYDLLRREFGINLFDYVSCSFSLV